MGICGSTSKIRAHGAALEKEGKPGVTSSTDRSGLKRTFSKDSHSTGSYSHGSGPSSVGWDQGKVIETNKEGDSPGAFMKTRLPSDYVPFATPQQSKHGRKRYSGVGVVGSERRNPVARAHSLTLRRSKEDGTAFAMGGARYAANDDTTSVSSPRSRATRGHRIKRYHSCTGLPRRTRDRRSSFGGGEMQIMRRQHHGDHRYFSSENDSDDHDISNSTR